MARPRSSSPRIGFGAFIVAAVLFAPVPQAAAWVESVTDQHVTVTLALPKGAALPGAVKVMGKETTVTLEGEWHYFQSGGFPRLVIHVPIHLPAKAKIQLKEASTDAGTNAVVLNLPLESGDSLEKQIPIHLEGAKKPEVALLKASIKLTPGLVLASPSCKMGGVNARLLKSDSRQPVGFLMDCSFHGNEMKLAVRAIADAEWKEFKAKTGEVSVNGKVHEVTAGLPGADTDPAIAVFSVAVPESREPASAYEVIKEASATQGPPRWWRQAALSGMFIKESGGGTNFTGVFAWTPSHALKGPLAVRGELGLGFLDGNDGQLFLSTDYQGFLEYGVTPRLALDGGGGAQTWIGHGGTAALLTLGPRWKLSSKWLDSVSEVVASYSAFFFPSDLAHEFKLGVTIAF